MILLQEHSLSKVRKIPLEDMSLQLKERDSTATITPADMTGITINSWMVDDTEPGKGIVWRVKSISESFTTRTPTVQLEHAINTLKDTIMFGEHKPKDITGNANATTCTAEQTVRFILDRSSDWVLGRFDYSVSNPYQFDGETLFDALETVTSSLKDAWWDYDMSTYPFRLNILRKSDTAYSELRPGRNLKTISKTIDKAGMYTRFYPIGKDDLHLSDYAVDKNTGTYGIIGKVDTDASIETEEELRRWASERLEDHAEPTVTIDVEGLDLADATGEELDRMWLGYCCRIPLQEFGTSIVERIVGLTFPDKLRQPEVVKVTLSNNRTDLTKILAESMKSTGKGGRTSAKQSKEDHAWFEDTDDHVAMCAEAIIGRSANGVDWKRFSSIIVDGEGIHQRVVKTEGDVVTAFTQIDLNEQRILMEAERAYGAESKLSGRITVEADRITSEVQNRISEQNQLSSRITQTATAIQTEVNARILGETQLDSRITQTANKIDMEVTRATTAEGNLSGRITVEAGKISQIVSAVGSDGQVTAASICLAINNGGSSATINADKIYLLGQTIANTITANYIDSKISTLATLHAKDISANSITAGVNLYLPNGLSVYTQGLWTISLSQEGNTYTLKQTTLNGTESTVGTFSRAVTSWTMGWSGGTFSAKANPQNQSCSTQIVQGSVSWDGNNATVPIEGIDSDNPGYQYFTGRNVLVDASGRYSAGRLSGWEDCYDDIGLNYSSNQTINPGGSITIYPAAKPTPSGSHSSIISKGITITANNADTPTNLGIYDTDSNLRSGNVNLGWDGSIDLWGGYKLGNDWYWGSKLTVKGKAFPSVGNAAKKSSGITGTNAGDVSNQSGNYVTFTVGGYDYYIKIG